MKLTLPWMSLADRRRWKSARTIADLGELTAQWLEGTLASQPAYAPNCGPEEESTELLDSLAALNRHGYMTTCSQPGIAEIGHDGRWWTQHAAVEGYLTNRSLYHRLLRAADELALIVVIDDPLADRCDEPFVVTHVDGDPYTAFGGRLGTRDLNAQYAVLHPEARAALTGAVHLAIVAPHYGSAAHRALWRALDQVTGLQPLDQDEDDTANDPRPSVST
ncbi:hypothetical protein OG264_39600 (plasmid) [Streptomyces xanthophaeus]|uniref:DUF6919 domain-containing protein n=1 Tax=Streptomyces xanthophaeus TaxID=67385 RepID=UPI002F90EC75|nr:hypothetical protein OG264_39755 [Streptomyces xanthophaeus]WST27639.1 hypothetical protein OG264_39600 [Streptomyces xanthophaeus]WST65993.1 hypothetical protein OG605_41010 [Streptomyces xanthophaeus]WST66021.1 hypothetical protein OG605_40855 [Streptomyces xanthophaeus]